MNTEHPFPLKQGTPLPCLHVLAIVYFKRKLVFCYWSHWNLTCFPWTGLDATGIVPSLNPVRFLFDFFFKRCWATEHDPVWSSQKSLLSVHFWAVAHLPALQSQTFTILAHKCAAVQEILQNWIIWDTFFLQGGVSKAENTAAPFLLLCDVIVIVLIVLVEMYFDPTVFINFFQGVEYKCLHKLRDFTCNLYCKVLL